MREIKQTWWHIHDQFKPSPGRIMRQVMDLYTDENYFEVPLGNFNFVRLKVRNRLNGNELPYLEGDTNIIVNLGNIMEVWPKARGLSDYKIRHIKLEVEYTLLDPPFKRRDIIFNLLAHRTLYYRAFMIDELIQPEYYITLPRGLRLRDKGKSSEMLLFIKFNDLELKKEMDDSGLKKAEKVIGENISGYKIRYCGPYIDKSDKCESYSYLVNNKNCNDTKGIYEILKGFIKKLFINELEDENEYYKGDYEILKGFNKKLEDDKSEIRFAFTYKVTYDRKLLIAIFGLGLTISALTLYRIWYLITYGGDGSFTIPFIIVFLSYIAILLKYYDEEYNLPLIYVIVAMIILFGFWALMEMVFMGSNSISLSVK